MSTRLEKITRYFRQFAETYAPTSGSPLYECLSYGVVDDPEMLELSAEGAESQPAANLLYAAVHYLLLEGADHPLRRWYPDVLDDPADAAPPDADTYPVFRDFVERHRDRVTELLRTRLVQTNVVRRSACMVHAFAEVARTGGGLPLATLELGSSAGLNLHWDRYRYTFRPEHGPVTHWGPADSPLQLPVEIRGPVPPPALPDSLPVVWRAGIDLNPIDLADPLERLWLRALIFPEHVERHRELEAAAQVARAHPVDVVTGAANDRLPDLLAKVPEDSVLCLYATVVLYQWTRDAIHELHDLLRSAAEHRPIWLLQMDGTADGAADVRLRGFGVGTEEPRKLAAVHPHGRWLAWDPRP